MEFVPKDSVAFRNSIEALVNFLPQASLHFTQDGLKIHGMDVSHVGFVELEICAADCATLTLSKPLTIGVDTAILARTLNGVGSSDRVTVAVNKAMDAITISYHNEKLNKKSTYSIRTLDIQEENLELPDLSYAATVSTKTSDVVNMVKEVAAFGETINLALNEDGFHVSCNGDAGTVKQTLLNSDDRVMDLTEDTVTASYGIKHIQNILKGGAPLSSTILIEFDSTQPLRTTFRYGSGSRFVTYLAPKVNEE